MDDLALGVWCHTQNIGISTLAPKNELMFRHKTQNRRADVAAMNLKIKNLCYPRCVVKQLATTTSFFSDQYLDLYHRLESQEYCVAEVGGAKKDWTLLAMMLATQRVYYYYDLQDEVDKNLAKSLEVRVVIDLGLRNTTIQGQVVFLNGPATHHYVTLALSQMVEAQWVVLSYVDQWWEHDNPVDHVNWGGEKSGFKHVNLNGWKIVRHQADYMLLEKV